MGRILAIDYGRKRTGIAVTDTLQIVANGLTTVPTHQLLTFLKQYVAKEPVERIVVGLPKQMNNEPSESMRYIKPFLAQLAKEMPQMPVEMYDERFTSVIAHRAMLDGGLRKIYADGSMKIASPKPAPVLQTKSEIERRVIGIVFQTDPSRIGTAEKSKLGEGNVHGLVMALKNTATDIQWSHEENNLEDVKDCWSKSEIYSDISGLHNYTKILDHANSIGGIEAYPAFEAVEKWNDMYSINEYRPPRNTTGWFIPSSGQWWDILQNLGGCPAMADKGQQTSSDSGDFRWLGQGDVPAALNAWMNKIAADSKNDFTTGDRFWSSSELNQFRARNWNVYSSDYVCCDFVYKKWSNAVRPVLAF